MIRTRRTATALTAAAALALGVVPAAFTTTSILAGGEEPTTLESGETTPTPAYVPWGWLGLETGTTNRTTLTKASPYPGTSGSPVPTTVAFENLYGISSGPNGCLLSTNSKSLNQTESLLGISASAPGSAQDDAASLSGGSIGAAEKKSGVSCYEVDAPVETLTLALNKASIKSPSGPLVASAAYLDLDLKGSVQLVATASRTDDKGDPVHGTTRTFELNGPGFTGENLDGATLFTCPATTAADSGSDSGTNDNCRWPISVPSWDGTNDNYYFDTLVIEALSGSFSLEGGADGVVEPSPPSAFPQGASLIELVQPYEGTLTCLTSIADPDAVATETGSGSVPDIKVTRIGNADGSTCLPVAYTLANALKQATFYKPLDVQTSAQFIVEMTWRVDPANTGSTTTPLLPDTKINFESSATSPNIPLRWCPDLVSDPGGSGFPVVQGIASKKALDQDTTLGGIQFACLISSDATDLADVPGDVVVLKQRMYLYGDAKWSL